MALSAIWFAVSAIISMVIHLTVPFTSKPAIAFLWIAASYCLFSIPFYFSGICVCLALTKFAKSAGLLYAADLVGAGTGCIALIAVMRLVDGPTATIVVGVVGCTSAIAFALDGKLIAVYRLAITLSVALTLLGVVTGILAAKQEALVRITWSKGTAEARPLYEKWNSFSRIAVDGNPREGTSVITEGISPTYPVDRTAFQLHLRIDGGAETTITSWKTPVDIDYLKYDVKNIVYHIRTNDSVLIIGAGGGRDVLSALLMGQRAVRAVEINQDILQTVNNEYGEFSGHLDRNPRVTFVNDEARSYIARTDERFDVIEASFVDTWAATAAGALTLTENSIYTTNAWKLFLNRLTPTGILSFSRWYSTDFPAETYRLVALAASTLRDAGIAATRGHIVLLSNLRNDIGGGRVGAATILIGKEPFSVREIDDLELLSKQMRFNVLLSPRTAADPVLSLLANGDLQAPAVSSLPLILSPPTDNCPFFFYLKPLRYAFRDTSSDRNGMFAPQMQSGEIVIVLLVLVVFLTLFFVLMPLFRDVQKKLIRMSVPYLVFFTGIGLGFMLIEVSLMQRLIIFLGHPTYSLSVVLATLLVSSGIGSYSTRWGKTAATPRAARLIVLLLPLAALGLVSHLAIDIFASSKTPTRITAAIAMLCPVGFSIGMALPLGFTIVPTELDALMPVFWGINGAASICASIVAMLIAMNYGISSAYWSGFFCYVIAVAAYAWMLWALQTKRANAQFASR
jgi:predicted membrane-bound spermidine synthase